MKFYLGEPLIFIEVALLKNVGQTIQVIFFQLQDLCLSLSLFHIYESTFFFGLVGGFVG